MKTTFLALSLAILYTCTSADAVEIACHRGANEYAPENTQAAAQKCIDWGADYVEIDIRTSQDGVLYILHDISVNRTTNGKGTIRSLTSNQIDQLDAGTWFDPKFAGEKVPRLESYLRWIKGKAKVYFDVKDADLKQLIDLVYDVGLEKDSFFWFENPKKQAEFRALNKELTMKVNASTPEKAREAKEKVAANIIEVSPDRLTPEMIKACHDLDLKLMVYEPAKDRKTFRRAIDLGADMINLNHADVFQEVEREAQQNKS